MLFPELIGSWESLANFVADFIIYEPLADPIQLPCRLNSPDYLLKYRRGNCFEMATLLCSLLNGSGYRTMVVSGYAAREVCLNDLERVDCPFIPNREQIDLEEMNDDEEVSVVKQSQRRNKYILRNSIDWRSKFDIEMAERAQLTVKTQQHPTLTESDDPYYGWRVHAWILIEFDGTVFFIEPSTGRRVETCDLSYLGIASVWNEFNYYVNLQETYGTMEWNFNDKDRWQALLMHDSDAISDKYLDMPHSWVSNLHVSDEEFVKKFPRGQKTIKYKRVIYDRYQNYYSKDGLVKKLTIFESLDYERQTEEWSFYENRADFLNLMRVDSRSSITRKYYNEGRPDKLRQLKMPTTADEPIVYYFYFNTRVDVLRRLEVHSTYIREYFGPRDDRLYSREFTQNQNILMKVCEKFSPPNPLDPTSLAIRTFDFNSGFIHMKFHYNKDEITPTIRIFKRPSDPEYEREY